MTFGWISPHAKDEPYKNQNTICGRSSHHGMELIQPIITYWACVRINFSKTVLFRTRNFGLEFHPESVSIGINSSKRTWVESVRENVECLICNQRIAILHIFNLIFSFIMRIWGGNGCRKNTSSSNRPGVIWISNVKKIPPLRCSTYCYARMILKRILAVHGWGPSNQGENQFQK